MHLPNPFAAVAALTALLAPAPCGLVESTCRREDCAVPVKRRGQWCSPLCRKVDAVVNSVTT